MRANVCRCISFCRTRIPVPQNCWPDLNADTWRDKILPRFRDREGTLALPRFKLDYDVTLNDPLKALGMRQAFDDDADFSAMADEPLFVSKVKQKSFVEVNEEGTEAAAVTTVTMTTAAMFRPEKPFEMIVDRPFLFVIGDDQTKSILFMGVIYDPAGQGGGLNYAHLTRPSPRGDGGEGDFVSRTANQPFHLF